MKKGKMVRLVGFVGALGLSTTLVVAAVQGTGAYFQESAPGTITGNSGQLSLGVALPGESTYTDSAAAQLALNFKDLWPGDTDTAQNIGYQVTSTGGTADLWLTFDPSSAGYQLLTGGADAPLSWVPRDTGATNKGGMGAFGYFQVSDSVIGSAFETGNLKFRTDDSLGEDPTTANDCTTDANGRGGSDWFATLADHSSASSTAGPHSSGFCGIPSAILLRSNIANTQSGTVSVTFALNGYKQTNTDQQYGPVNFHLVVTQHGQRPTV